MIGKCGWVALFFVTQMAVAAESSLEWLHWRNADRATPAGVALVIHGLNLKPEKMSSIEDLFLEQGISTLRVSLSGHRNTDIEEFKAVSADHWLEETRIAYLSAQAAAQRHQVPLYFAGFSIGALTMMTLQQTQTATPVKFERMFLFAPAIALQSKTYMLKALFWNDNLVVPSFSSKEIRVHDGTPVPAYKALFELVDRLAGSGFQKPQSPTLVLMDPDDSLVNIDGIRGMIHDHQLASWDLQPVSNRGCSGDYCNAHYITEEKAVGASEWLRIKKLVQQKLIRII